MSKNPYRWQGKRVKVRFGTYTVSENKSSPLYWYNYEVLHLKNPKINCIEVTYEKQVFYIYNGHGYGVRKLEAGGWPDMGHMSVGYDVSLFTEYTSKEWDLIKFSCLNDDMVKFKIIEDLRQDWFRKMYPVEMGKMDALKNLISKKK